MAPRQSLYANASPHDHYLAPLILACRQLPHRNETKPGPCPLSRPRPSYGAQEFGQRFLLSKYQTPAASSQSVKACLLMRRPLSLLGAASSWQNSWLKERVLP